MIIELLHSHPHVSWLIWTGVQVPVILRKMINIMEDKASPIEVPDGLLEANIEQHALVDVLVAVRLVNNINPVVNILPYQKGMNMTQKHREVFSPVFIRHNNSHVMWAVAGGRDVFSTRCKRCRYSLHF